MTERAVFEIILSSLNTNGLVKIKESCSTRDHTENMLKSMGYNIKVKENSLHRFIEMKNNQDLKTINYNVPGDPSSAAFFISAACCCISAITFLTDCCSI